VAWAAAAWAVWISDPRLKAISHRKGGLRTALFV
jgi:hypothetical protein